VSLTDWLAASGRSTAPTTSSGARSGIAFACSMRSSRLRPSIAAKPPSSRTTSAPSRASSSVRHVSGCAIRPCRSSAFRRTTGPAKPAGGAQSARAAADVAATAATGGDAGARSRMRRSPVGPRTVTPSGATTTSVVSASIFAFTATSRALPSASRNSA